MKCINYLNYFFVGVPALMIGLGWMFDEGLTVQGLLLTMLTGLFQVVIGILVFVNSGFKDRLYAVYLLAVAIFFTLWIFTDLEVIMIMPPILAVYLSVLLFIDAKAQRQ